jgi:hypothetical protein
MHWNQPPDATRSSSFEQIDLKKALQKYISVLGPEQRLVQRELSTEV